MKRFLKTGLISLAVGLSVTPAPLQAKPITGSAMLRQNPEAPKEKFGLIVSFTSKGTGTASDQRAAFLKYVSEHKKKPAYKAVSWGREGETDYCFPLTELSKKEKKAFIKDVKKIVAGSDRIFVEENAECRHQGRTVSSN